MPRNTKPEGEATEREWAIRVPGLRERSEQYAASKPLYKASEIERIVREAALKAANEATLDVAKLVASAA